MIQLWETLATVAKAAFFFLATPLLLSHLGRDGYGLLAMALSVTACVVGLDFGTRPYLRVALSALPRGGDGSWQPVLGDVLGAFLGIQALGLVALAAGAKACLWSHWLGIDPSGDWLLVIALLGGGAYMTSLLLIEPLAATRRLSLVKAAGFAGNALAVPAVVLTVLQGGTAIACFIAYSAALTLPNLLVAAFYLPESFGVLIRVPTRFHLQTASRIILHGRWFGLSNAQWLLQSYLLTFLMSGLFGPAQAGRFFILLKLSELLSVFGANTSETSISELAAAHRPIEERRQQFISSYQATLAASSLVFAFLANLTPIALQLWFHFTDVEPWIGVWVATFGFAGAFKRVINSACLGLHLVRSLALWEFVETAIALGGLIALQHLLGTTSAFVAGVISVFALARPAQHVARALGSSSSGLWLKPAAICLLAVATSAVFALMADSSPGWLKWVWAAFGCSVGIAAAAYYIHRLRLHAS